MGDTWPGKRKQGLPLRLVYKGMTKGDCELLGVAADGRRVCGLVRDDGDPSNRATVKFVCESALSLALAPDALPGGRERSGVLTPATGLGHALAERLPKADVMIDIGMRASACIAH